jgi:hypothetical protein
LAPADRREGGVAARADRVIAWFAMLWFMVGDVL